MPPLAVVAMSPSDHEFSAPDYTAVSVSDDTRHTTGQVGNPNRAAVRFVFTIAEDPATITQLDLHGPLRAITTTFCR